MASAQIHAKAAVMRYITLLPMITIALLWPLAVSAQVMNNQSAEPYPDVEYATPLSGAELATVFDGKTHQGSYNFLNRDISTFAFKETTAKDGKIRHIQQGHVDTGKWNIADDTICYDYDDPRLRQACFKIFTRGNCYYHYQVSVEGIARFGFTARTVIAGETPSCEPSLV
jgi:hypothetical protein